MDNNQKKITKCLKSYLSGKKYYETNKEKSFEYFKQCMQIMNDIRDNNIQIDDKYSSVIDETETECAKILTDAIENTIEEPTTDNYNNENNLYSIIENGNLNTFKEYKYGQINFDIYNDDGLTPLHYAIKYGDTTFLKHAFNIGAKIDQTCKIGLGHTLLEYACLEKDPNMINFLIQSGANMHKHLTFRDGKKFNNIGNQIDIILLEKIILDNQILNYKIKHLAFVFNFIKQDTPIDIEYFDMVTKLSKQITNYELILYLDYLVDKFEDDTRTTYIEILKEELNYTLIVKLGCPSNKIEIILYNLCPFINYQYNLDLHWLLSLEIKFIILKILKKNKLNIKELKEKLISELYNSYIQNNILPKNLVQTIVFQLFYKIKV